MKYELTSETRRIPAGRTLHRIRALRDIPQHSVMKGDLGGWVESENNLAQGGDAWVSESAHVVGRARISENALVHEYAQVREYAQVLGHAQVYGNSLVGGNTLVGANARIGGNAAVGGNARVVGNALIDGAVMVDGDAAVDNDALVDSGFFILTATIYTSQRLYATAFRQQDGSWRVLVGCWSGSIAELRALAESDAWVETQPEDTEEARPELLAFVALCESRAARMVA